MTSVALIMTSGFADWEYAFIAGIGSSFYGVDVRFFAPDLGRFQSQGGLSVSIEGNLQRCLDWQPNVVAVIGGMIWESPNAPDLRKFLCEARSNGLTVAGICGGTLALARAGLLDKVLHTSNSADFLQRNAPCYDGGVLYRNSSSALISDGIITASGTAPVSFTSAVFECAGIKPEIVAQFRAMLAEEHR